MAAGELHGETLPALELWKQMLKMLFETGHPWMTFKDPCNVRSPQDHAGVVHSSNLCTEITLNTGATRPRSATSARSCSTSTSRADGEIDHAKLRETVRDRRARAGRRDRRQLLPDRAGATANMRHRPVGLGVMGLQYALYRRGAPFASRGGRRVLRRGDGGGRYYAYEASSDLAAERGRYPSYAGSKWDRGLLPQDTVDLLERRARRGDRRAARRPPGLGAAAGEDRRAGHAQLERDRDRADGDDREHHGHLALHRADLQEPVRQVEPVRRLHGAQPVPGARPEGGRAVGRADGRRS